ncbi:MAG: TonB family protein [Opitutae bacterium]|nr:TonB family protein [Opitutae bacterium]
MKTENLSRKPHLPRPHFPPGSVPGLPLTPPSAGSWRYASVPKTRWASAIAFVAAAGLHAAMFYGFSSPSAPARPVAAPKPESVIRMEMPPLPPEENEDQPRELAEESASAVAVPQLAEPPASVALSDFAQAVDFRPRVDIDVNTLKSMTIPAIRSRGGAGLGGRGTIFNLAQLDRAPQPIAQPPPHFPANVRPDLTAVMVVVEFVVDAEGRVVDPRVTRTNAPEFNSAAIIGVARWKFRPGMLSGRKVATRMEVPLKFELTPPE